MSVVYGVRPFVRGVIHSVFYEEIELQLMLLSLSDVIIIFVLAEINFQSDIFKSKICLTLLYVYFLLTILQNCVFCMIIIL